MSNITVTEEMVDDLVVAELYYEVDKPFYLIEHNPEAFKAVQSTIELISHCTLVLKNGYTVTGTSTCIDPRNHSLILGRKYAKEKAMRMVYDLIAFTLKDSVKHE